MDRQKFNKDLYGQTIVYQKTCMDRQKINKRPVWIDKS